MVSVKVQRYIREEKYYIIPTSIKNQYIGASYDSNLDAVRIDMFVENEKNIEGYFIPRVTTQIILSRYEIDVLQRMMTMLWNQSDSNNTYNKAFNIRHNRAETTTIKLIKSKNKNLLVLNNLVKQPTELHKSISFTLERYHCKALYSIIRFITKGK